MPQDAVPAVIPGYRLKVVANRIVLVDATGRPRLSLSVPEVRIWKSCTGGSTVAAVCGALKDHYADACTCGEHVTRTLQHFYAHGVLSFRCDPSAVSSKTYHVNMSALVRHILDGLGWRAARPGELAEFAFFNRWPWNLQLAKYQTFDTFLTYCFNHKHRLAERVTRRGLNALMPETYTTFDAFARHADRGQDNLWFLKLGRWARQRGVSCHRGYDEILRQAEAFALRHGDEPYVIQRGIDGPYLIGGRKITLRIMLLILADGSMYMHQKACVKMQNVAYDAADTSPQVQFFHQDLSYTTVDDHPQLAGVEAEISESAAAVLSLFTDDYCVLDDPGRYALLGLDYVLDCNRRPYLVEINHAPGLNMNNPTGSWYRTKVSLINDWLGIVVHGRRDAEVGGFVKVA